MNLKNSRQKAVVYLAIAGAAIANLAGLEKKVNAEYLFPIKTSPKNPYTTFQQEYSFEGFGTREIIDTAVGPEYRAVVVKNETGTNDLYIMSGVQNPKEESSLEWTVAKQLGYTYDPNTNPPNVAIPDAQNPRIVTFFNDLGICLGTMTSIFYDHAGAIEAWNISRNELEPEIKFTWNLTESSDLPSSMRGYLSHPFRKGENVYFRSKRDDGKNVIVRHNLAEDMFFRVDETYNQLGDVDASELGVIFWSELVEPNSSEPNSPYFPNGGRWIIKRHDLETRTTSVIEDNPEKSAPFLSVSGKFLVYALNKKGSSQLVTLYFPDSIRSESNEVYGNIERVRAKRSIVGFDWNSGQNYRIAQGIFLAAGANRSFFIDPREFVPTRTYEDGTTDGYYSLTNPTFAVSVLPDINSTTVLDANKDPDKCGGAFFAAYAHGPMETGDPNSPTLYGIFGRKGNLVINPSQAMIDLASNWLRESTEFEALKFDPDLSGVIDEEDFIYTFDK